MANNMINTHQPTTRSYIFKYRGRASALAADDQCAVGRKKSSTAAKLNNNSRFQHHRQRTIESVSVFFYYGWDCAVLSIANFAIYPLGFGIIANVNSKFERVEKICFARSRQTNRLSYSKKCSDTNIHRDRYKQATYTQTNNTIRFVSIAEKLFSVLSLEIVIIMSIKW